MTFGCGGVPCLEGTSVTTRLNGAFRPHSHRGIGHPFWVRLARTCDLKQSGVLAWKVQVQLLRLSGVPTEKRTEQSFARFMSSWGNWGKMSQKLQLSGKLEPCSMFYISGSFIFHSLDLSADNLRLSGPYQVFALLTLTLPLTFPLQYPADKCCENILFYLEDQMSILNARMNCWQKESLLRPEDDQILRLTPRFSWSGCHMIHPKGR